MLMKESEEQGTSVLGRIIGARLTSVNFVLDYLILGFDEKGALTTLVWPELSVAGRILKFGMQGYRDCLCELITEVVLEAEISATDTITISFGVDYLRIPLRERQSPGEKAILTGPQHFLHVW